jgi:pyruvate formate lyase activating enzyme
MADTDHIVSCREDGLIEIHPEAGKHPETYEDVCPAQALTVVGEKKSVREILDVVEQDAVFYRNSYGGMTLSGGEPLMQPDFSETLLKEAGKRHIHRAIETTGFAVYPNLERVFENLDLILYDIKLLDEEKHRRFTGVSNKMILENFDRMRRQFPQKPVCVRTPVIPGVNDTVQEISAIRDFVKQYPNTSYELLKYHRLGESKYHSLGRTWRMGDAELSEETWQRLQELL